MLEPLLVSLMRRITAGFSPFLCRLTAASWVSTFSQFSAISSCLDKIRPRPSCGRFFLMYVLLHFQSISSQIWLSVSSPPFSVIAIFHSTSEFSSKLSNCLPGCLCELSVAATGVHRVDLWNEVYVQRV